VVDVDSKALISMQLALSSASGEEHIDHGEGVGISLEDVV